MVTNEAKTEAEAGQQSWSIFDLSALGKCVWATAVQPLSIFIHLLMILLSCHCLMFSSRCSQLLKLHYYENS